MEETRTSVRRAAVRCSCMMSESSKDRGIAVLCIDDAICPDFVRVPNFIEFQRAVSNVRVARSFAGGCVAAASLAGGGQMSGGVVAGVPLQDDRGCATETGELAVFGDAEIWRSACEHGAGHLFLNDRTEARPGGGEVAGDENDLRRQRCGDEPEAAAEVSCLPGDGGDGGGVALFCEAKQIVNVERAWRVLRSWARARRSSAGRQWRRRRPPSSRAGRSRRRGRWGRWGCGRTRRRGRCGW